MGIGDRITTAANIMVSVDRFARFLRAKEIDTSLRNEDLQSDFVINIKNGWFSWDY